MQERPESWPHTAGAVLIEEHRLGKRNSQSKQLESANDPAYFCTDIYIYICKEVGFGLLPPSSTIPSFFHPNPPA